VSAGRTKDIRRDPWLANPHLRAQRTWELKGWGSHRFACYLLRKGDRPTLCMLIRNGDPVEYCRLLPDYALAAIDAAPRLFAREGIDANGRAWKVRVVPRQRPWEVRLTYGGIIPLVTDVRDRR
jgi:hypothetical protein